MNGELSSKLLEGVAEANRRRETAVLATVFVGGQYVGKCVLWESGEIICGSLENSILQEVKRQVPALIGGNFRARTCLINGADGQINEVFLEVLKSRTRLIVFGAGHVGQAVALMGAFLGFRVQVYDDREELLTRERLPDRSIEASLCDFGEVASVLGNLRNSVVVIVTRGHQYDEDCLRAVLGSEALYVGMIGSKRRVLSIFRRLEQGGASREELSRVHAPIGLRIGAVTPQEIAVSILAEVIQVLSQQDRKLSAAI